MPRSSRLPKLRLHKPSQLGIVTLNGHDVYLGRWPRGRKEPPADVRAEYDRVIAEWLASGRGAPRSAADATPSGLTVAELVLAFWAHAEQHYRHPDGSPTGELFDYKVSLRPLVHLYGQTPAKDFGPLALKAVRRLMIDGYEHPKHGKQPALSRGVINQRVGRIRRLFKWGVENELVPAPVLQALQAVRGLEQGRSPARETEPVKAVPDAFVDPVLPHLRPQVSAMVQLQRHTGMRPGEVVRIRGIDLDMTGKVWLYVPGSDQGKHGSHKTAHKGRQRVVAIGPRAQEVIRPWLRLNVAEYLFQPREAVAALRAEQRASRKTKVQPSQLNRRKRNPRRKPGERYRVGSYAVAVTRGIEATNRARACDGCKEKEAGERCEACQAGAIPHWHPHQLRHTKGTEIRRAFGLDAARAVLGHQTPVVTEVYAELDCTKAVEVMERLG